MSRNGFVRYWMALRHACERRRAARILLLGVLLGAIGAVEPKPDTSNQPELSPPEVVAKNAHECVFGDGTQVLASDFDTTGARSVSFSLRWIANGEVKEIAVGTYESLHKVSRARVYVILCPAFSAESGQGRRVDMSAAFMPTERGTWKRNEFRLPVGMFLMHQRSWLSAKALEGEPFPILTLVFSPEQKVIDQIMRGHRSVQEWRAITKGRSEGVLVAEALFR